MWGWGTRRAAHDDGVIILKINLYNNIIDNNGAPTSRCGSAAHPPPPGGRLDGLPDDGIGGQAVTRIDCDGIG